MPLEALAVGGDLELLDRGLHVVVAIVEQRLLVVGVVLDILGRRGGFIVRLRVGAVAQARGAQSRVEEFVLLVLLADALHVGLFLGAVLGVGVAARARGRVVALAVRRVGVEGELLGAAGRRICVARGADGGRAWSSGAGAGPAAGAAATVGLRLRGRRQVRHDGGTAGARRRGVAVPRVLGLAQRSDLVVLLLLAGGK